jgi:Phosphoglucose isomerase
MSVPALHLRPAWALLKKHHQKIKRVKLRQLFAKDRERGERLVVEAAGVYFDYSKNRITDETMGLLLQLAQESGLRDRIDAMFRGDKINTSEKRAVLHVALRAALPSFTTAKMWCPRSTPCSTKWRIFPSGCAAAPGRDTPASASAM